MSSFLLFSPSLSLSLLFLDFFTPLFNVLFIISCFIVDSDDTNVCFYKENKKNKWNFFLIKKDTTRKQKPHNKYLYIFPYKSFRFLEFFNQKKMVFLFVGVLGVAEVFSREYCFISINLLKPLYLMFVILMRFFFFFFVVFQYLLRFPPLGNIFYCSHSYDLK